MNGIANDRLGTVHIVRKAESPARCGPLLLKAELAAFEARFTRHVYATGFNLFLGNSLISVALAIALSLP